MGARGIEFDWKYIQKSLDSNISLVHFLTLSCLVWLWMRRDVNRAVVPLLGVLILLCTYKVGEAGRLRANSSFFYYGIFFTPREH